MAESNHLTRGGPMPAPRVLVVEDDARERAALREVLEDEGIVVVGEAGDGDEAVTLTASLRPEVVLMDLRMPTVNGFEATRLIKEAVPATQVMILTVYDGPVPERSAEEAGAYAYLVKGCSPELIRDVVMKARTFKRDLETRAAQAPPSPSSGPS